MSQSDQVTTLHQIFANATYYDLSHEITPGIPSWPSSDVPIQIDHVITHEKDGGSKWKIVCGTDAGTHIDSPYHFYRKAATVTDLQTVNFFVPLCIIDITERAQQNADTELDMNDVKQYESQYGTIPQNAFIAMRSGWTERWTDKHKYSNINTSEKSKLIKEGLMHFPGFTADAVKFLVADRHISGIGVDTYSFDAGYKDAFPAHKELLSKNKYGIENMRITSDVPVHGCLFVALPARVKHAPESWIRCVAVQPNTAAKL